MHEQKLQTGKEKELVKANLLKKDHQKYVCEKFNLTTREYNDIDWPSYGISICKMALTCQWFITKFSSGWLPTNVLTSQYNDTARKCLVREEDEDNSHIMTCKKQEQWRQKTIYELQQTLTKRSTAPHLKELILQGVEKVIREGLKTTIRIDEIEWRAFTCGYISKTIIQQQEKHYEELSFNTTGRNWARQIRQHLWR